MAFSYQLSMVEETVHGHDTVHEGRRDAGGEVSDEDVLVGDTCEGRVVFEVRNILNKGW